MTTLLGEELVGRWRHGGQQNNPVGLPLWLASSQNQT